jgi:hypothetical protein
MSDVKDGIKADLSTRFAPVEMTTNPVDGGGMRSVSHRLPLLCCSLTVVLIHTNNDEWHPHTDPPNP